MDWSDLGQLQMHVGKVRWWVVKVELELTRRLLGLHRIERSLAYDAWPPGCSARSAPRHPQWTVRGYAPAYYVCSGRLQRSGRVGDGGGVGRSRGGVSRTVCGIQYGADERLCDENDDEQR